MKCGPAAYFNCLFSRSPILFALRSAFWNPSLAISSKSAIVAAAIPYPLFPFETFIVIIHMYKCHVARDSDAKPTKFAAANPRFPIIVVGRNVAEVRGGRENLLEQPC